MGRKTSVPRLKDVSAAAQVSVGTASDALAGRGRMSAETRKRVQDIAAGLGYHPNALAQSLRKGKANVLGMHHQDLKRALGGRYLTEFMTGAILESHLRDFDISILASNVSAPRQVIPRVDGVIIIDPIGDDTRAKELMDLQIPVVAGEFTPASLQPDFTVAADHEGALMQILGTIDVAAVQRVLVVAPDDNSGWGIKIREVIQEWATQRRIQFDSVKTAFGLTDLSRFERELASHWSSSRQPDLVVGSTGKDVALVDKVMRSKGLDPERDALLVSCSSDSNNLLSWSDRLTHLVLPAREIGSTSAQLLLDYIENRGHGSTGNRTVLIPVTVNLRDSTRR